MAYSTPPNFTAGTPLAEGDLDILSDDIAFLANPPKCRIYNSANLSIPHNTATTLTFNSERQDTDTMHSTSVNTGRITMNTAGFYIVGISLEFASNATGTRRVDVSVGATVIASEIDSAVSGDVTRKVVSTGYQFAAGDYVTFIVTQTSGGALNVNAGGNYSPEAWAIWQSL